MPEERTMTRLSTEVVEALVVDCLYPDEDRTPGKTPEGAVIVEGILCNFGFRPEKCEEHAEAITELLNQLPDSFHAGSGGGMSFLKACNDKHGNRWTGFQRTMAHLFALGMAIGKVTYCLPRELWNALPGSMPYIVVDTRQ